MTAQQLTARQADMPEEATSAADLRDCLNRMEQLAAQLNDVQSAVDALNPARFADDTGRIPLGGGATPAPWGAPGYPTPHGPSGAWTPPGGWGGPDGWGPQKGGTPPQGPETLAFLPSIVATLRAAVPAQPIAIKVNQKLPVTFSLRRNGELVGETVKATVAALANGAANIQVSFGGAGNGLSAQGLTGAGGFITFDVLGVTKGPATLNAVATSVLFNPSDKVTFTVV
jgi:hypothetical protein